MSYVQGNALTNGSLSGNPGASLTGVTASHGLFAYLYFTTPGPTGISIADSAGTTWATSGSVIALTNAGTAVICAVATSTVAAGTHTLTVTYTGGGSCSTMIVEDTLTTFRTAAVGQRQNSPGSGNTLNPGASVANSGDLVYLFAVDTAGATTAQQAVAGTGGFTIPAGVTGNNTNIGCAWAVGYNASAGGTTPTLAPGTGSGSDEYGVIGFGFVSGGGGNSATIAWAG